MNFLNLIYLYFINVSGDESLCNFEFAQIVWSVFIEATKRSLEVGAMKDLLPNSRLKDEIVRNYEVIYKFFDPFSVYLFVIRTDIYIALKDNQTLRLR